MPSTARPPLMWSMVVIALTARAGFRNVLAPTKRPSRMRDVEAATAARAV